MIKMTEFAQRRKRLMKTIGPTSIVILPAAPMATRSNDTAYPYRQNSDFYYLTGFDEPEAVMVLAPKRAAGEFILFNRPREREKEIWDGFRAGQEGARKKFGSNQAFSIVEFEKQLPELLEGREHIHCVLGINKEFDELVFRALNQVRGKIRSGLQSPVSIVDITPSIHEMRLFKSKAEVALIRKAIDISTNAHIRAMQLCKPGIYEYQLEAELMHEFCRHGARSPSYTSIVGSGANSCILHYVSNNQAIHDKDMVLIDAGAEYQMYAADLTRAFPANGRFSAEQRAIYEIVLESQLAAIKAIKPGIAWPVMQQVIVKVITEGLLEIGLLKGNLKNLIEKQAYLPFYMHKSGHWMGLDVHDMGRYKIDGKWRTLQPGMVFTVEPGIYISAEIPGVPARWHNIGIRIEDDVLVTKKGFEVLSKNLPKTVADVEAVMAMKVS
ncbi:MAG: Xaa-Pro aminopeptidase [Gammaproteobacteria bacterium RIFCSPHIGHO2_12_FULL_45_9]|nr:MAG: Xaa-Pro aminopeptidase [Gammaproteobacteria bacterium RIFCSPHIGHO2_12_FULL_45_9]